MAPSNTAQPLPDLLGRVTQRITGRLEALLSTEDSTLDEWRVLSLLAHAGGQSMSAIAEAAMLAPPTLTKRIDRMVADGLVHRRVDATDRRRVLVLLVPRGHERHERLAHLLSGENSRVAALARLRPGLDIDRLTDMLAELLLALEAAEQFHNGERFGDGEHVDDAQRLDQAPH